LVGAIFKMSKPLVSAVVITYKRPDRLKRAIQTIIDQTYDNLEIIVVDGANSEENKKVTNSFDDERIIYTPVEPWAVNMYSQYGMQHARNVGCKKAKGNYIAMLDDDDSWHPEKTEKQLQYFDDDVGLVICYNKIISGKTEVIDKSKLEPTFADLLKSFNLSSTSTFLMRRDVLEKVGFWNEKLRGMHEYDIALKMTKMGYRIITVPEPLMIRERISNTDAKYYYIKIAEVIDFWHYFGKDILSVLGFFGFFQNAIKTVFLFMVYLMGYFIKEKVWEIIYPLKIMYQ